MLSYVKKGGVAVSSVRNYPDWTETLLRTWREEIWIWQGAQPRHEIQPTWGELGEGGLQWFHTDGVRDDMIGWLKSWQIERRPSEKERELWMNEHKNSPPDYTELHLEFTQLQNAFLSQDIPHNKEMLKEFHPCYLAEVLIKLKISEKTSAKSDSISSEWSEIIL